jgi:Na+/H+ antiporter NhaA
VVVTAVLVTAVVDTVVVDTVAAVVVGLASPLQAASASVMAIDATSLERKTSSRREDEGGRSVP